MNPQQIKQILQRRAFPDNRKKPLLLETHISWVILGKHYAFKIKKPCKYSFLDFSSPEKRRYYCEQELVLNRRLTDGVYLDVLPVRQQAEGPVIGAKKGKVIDYALRMRKLRGSLRMDKLLAAGKVETKQVRALAKKTARFHLVCKTIRSGPDPDKFRMTFNDLLTVENAVSDYMGAEGVAILKEAVASSNAFIHQNRELMKKRYNDGLVRDVHGDLYAKNIFLYKDPIIFDCIEFNDRFRQIDVLNELAFFCMDMEYYGRKDLADTYLENYLCRFPAIRNRAERDLFRYYKLYRANVKAKVSAWKAIGASNAAEEEKRADHMKKYLRLMADYLPVLT